MQLVDRSANRFSCAPFLPRRLLYHRQSGAVLLLRSCESATALRKIHARVLRTHEFFEDTFLATKLLEVCAVVARDMHYALRIFGTIDRSNSYTWTTVIRGYVELKLPERAIHCYHQMRWQGIEPNKFTFLFMLKAYWLVPSRREGSRIHGKLVKTGLGSDAFLNSALIHFYSKYSDTEAAHRLLDENPHKNVVAWNAMLAASFASKDAAAARKLFDQMPEKNVASWNAAISGFSRIGRLDVARSLFDEMPERDLLSWSAMITSYAQCRCSAEAINLFREMLAAGVRPDCVTVVSVLTACGRVGALDIGKWIHAYVARNKLRQDVVLGTALVDMYAKCGCVDIAVQVFYSMQQRNLLSWNAMLHGLSMHGRGSAALELFEQMEQDNVQPNDVTFVGVLSACSHSGLVEEGWSQFKRMCKEFHIVPKIEHYGCMVDLLARAGRIDEAKDLIRSMPMEPNVVVWGALLHACKIHGDVGIGNFVDEHLNKLTPKDGGSYVLLSNCFAANNCWNEVTQMRRLMNDAGVEKIPGCSSIEVDGVIHEFLVESKAHAMEEQLSDALYMLNIHLNEEGHFPG